MERRINKAICSKNCTICLEKMNKNIVVFKCKHFFHYDCVFKWLFEKNYCPLCKKELIRNN